MFLSLNVVKVRPFSFLDCVSDSGYSSSTKI